MIPETIQNPYTLPTLGLLLALTGFLGAARSSGRKGGIFSVAGVLVLFISLQRYGSSPGSASPALQMLILLCVLTPTLVGLMNRRANDAMLNHRIGVAFAILHVPALPLPWPAWLELSLGHNLPLLYLLVSTQLGIFAMGSAESLLDRRLTGVNLLQFAWLLLFGVGTMGGLPAAASAVPAMAAVTSGLGLALLLDGTKDGVARRAMSVAPAALFAMRLAITTNTLPVLVLVTAFTLAILHFQARHLRRA